MSKYELSIGYRKIKFLGITMPFSHTFLKIKVHRKTLYAGFNSFTKWLWSFGLLFPVLGKMNHQKEISDFYLIISREKKEIEKLLKLLGSHNWVIYHSVLRNCFTWRNSLLRAAGIKAPKDGWFNHLNGKNHAGKTF